MQIAVQLESITHLVCNARNIVPNVDKARDGNGVGSVELVLGEGTKGTMENIA
jgi:hypothetical protein